MPARTGTAVVDGAFAAGATVVGGVAVGAWAMAGAPCGPAVALDVVGVVGVEVSGSRAITWPSTRACRWGWAVFDPA